MSATAAAVDLQPAEPRRGVASWLALHRAALLFAALAVAILVRNLVGLATVPPGLYVDESSVGYNAWAIAHFARDEHGVTLPLFPQAFGEFKNPVYIYALAPLTWFLPLTAAVTRTPAAIFGLIAAIFLGLAAWRLTKSALTAFVTLLLAGLTPWLTLQSRVAFEVICMVAALAFMLYALARADSDSAPRRRWLVWAGAGAAVAVFAYSTGRLQVALFCCAFLIAYIAQLRRAIYFLLPVGVGYLLLSLWMGQHPGALTLRFGAISITHDNPSAPVALGRFVANYTSYFSPEFLFFRGDHNPRHSTQAAGMLLITALPLLLAGIFHVARHWRRPLYRFLLIAFCLGPVSAALTEEGTPHALRSADMLPLLILFCGLGLHELLSLVAHRRRTWQALTAAAVVAIALPGLAYQDDLFGAYARNPHVQAAFDSGEIAGIEAARRIAGSHTVFVVDDGWLDQPYIQAAFRYLPVPPERPVNDNVAALLAPLGMRDVADPAAVTMVTGDVVLQGVGDVAPAGTTVAFRNDYATVYVVTAGG